MLSSLRHIFSRSVDTASSLGKPIVAASGHLGRRAAEQIGDLLGAEGQPRYAAFISYSHRDMVFARWLHRALENYRVPRALVGSAGDYGPVRPRLRPVFRDEDELAGAAELGPKLQGALASSAALVVICSPAAARSAWVDKEIRTFKTMNPDRPVFGVIADGVPGSAESECFPEPLRFALRPDGSTDFGQPLEPLAPDVQKLERKVVKLKLIAGLLGTDYNNLYRRDRRRAQKIGAAVAVAAVLLITVLSGLSIAALTYARIAVKERNAAEVARQTAVRERNAAVEARDLAERRAWLAQRAAEEIRFLATHGPPCPPSAPTD